MKLNTSVFKTYDIRGIYGKEIDEQSYDKIIRAIYTFFVNKLKKNNLRIALGRDMRISSPSLFKVAKNALIDLGANVIDVGLVSTPTFYFSVFHYKYDCGIQVSASHNPKEYNGLKFVIRDDNKIIKIGRNTGMNDVKGLAISGKFLTSKRKGKVIKNDKVLMEEVKNAFKSIKPKHIKNLKIVVDPANAMGILYLDELFKHLNCQLIKINFKLDGTFPSHQPDPFDFKNLVDLQKKVKEEKADLGIAPDGDGDRVFFIDEKGNIINASLTTSILVQDILRQNPNEKILIDVRYTRNISNITKKYGGIPLIGKIGHALITEHMIRKDVIFSGESSGHYFYRETGYAESSVLTILRLLEIIGSEGKPISKLVNEVRTSFESGEHNFILNPSVNAKKITDSILTDYSDGKLNNLDGIAVDFPDWRFSIRSSNTEPLLRLNVEGNNRKTVELKLNELKKKIVSIGAKPKD